MNWLNEGLITYFILEILFLIVILKIKTKTWWRFLNLGIFLSYSIKSYLSFFFDFSDSGNWTLLLNTQLTVLAHLVLLLMWERSRN
jgi:hypothetical protein